MIVVGVLYVFYMLINSVDIIYMLIEYSSPCWWCWCYCRRKWIRRIKSKSWTRLFAFHIVSIPLAKLCIQLFSLQRQLNSRIDWLFNLDMTIWHGRKLALKNWPCVVSCLYGGICKYIWAYTLYKEPSQLGLLNTPTASLQRGKSHPTSVLDMTLNNIMVKH